MTDLKTTALWLHELYQALLEAGFQEDVALTLISDRLPDLPED